MYRAGFLARRKRGGVRARFVFGSIPRASIPRASQIAAGDVGDIACCGGGRTVFPGATGSGADNESPAPGNNRATASGQPAKSSTVGAIARAGHPEPERAAGPEARNRDSDAEDPEVNSHSLA